MPQPEAPYGLDRCPQCGIAVPHLEVQHHQLTSDGPFADRFVILSCKSCRHCTMVKATLAGNVIEVWPAPKQYSTDIPDKARRALQDANAALGIPSLSIVGSARAVDFMLAERGISGGKGTNLAARINEAAAQHLITPDMKAWADEVRLDANAERHADTTMGEPTKADAERCLRFAEALAEILFELPARVSRGRKPAPKKDDTIGSLASGGGSGGRRS